MPSAINHWVAQRDRLLDAYFKASDSIANAVRLTLVARALLPLLGERPRRIVDVGGGNGRQALTLAAAGHSVVIIEPDDRLYKEAAESIAHQPGDVRSRVHVVKCDGETAHQYVHGAFDLVCCHSVLMYLDAPHQLLASLVNLAGPSGLISIVSVNPRALALRSGLQRRWKEAKSLIDGSDEVTRYLRSPDHPREEVVAMLRAIDAGVVDWYGVGFFSDAMADGEIAIDDFLDICELEWAMGARDPYRHVARCYHVIAKTA